MNRELFPNIPSVDIILKSVDSEKNLSNIPRTIIKEKINQFLDKVRQDIKDGKIKTREQLLVCVDKSSVLNFLKKSTRPKYRRVINGTGVVVHTNLGRSLLSQHAIDAVIKGCTSYTNLEFSLDTGKRGSRYSLVEDLLLELTGAEAGLVVNNNAGAVLIVLNTLAKGKEVIVSRGELIEIGGSFRIPDVMRSSGAILREVGATNRTHLHDYEQAISPNTGALFKAHTSNYRIIGFHKEVSIEEMVELGTRYDLPVIEDLGSGNFYEFPDWLNIDEPTVQDRIKKGASVVSFSGDKLLGGPQAGIIVGKRQYIEKIKKNPLNRALRIDKMTLAALEATLRLYKDKDLAGENIPTLKLILTPVSTLQSRAKRLVKKLKQDLGELYSFGIKKGNSRVGGGASPEKDLPTYLVSIKPGFVENLDVFRSVLLDTDPPIVGIIEDDYFMLDVRTLLKDDLPVIPNVLREAYKIICGD
ncbi:L-seryl-tRNA(Sec) selenium transferase [Desulfothermus okinawensis JCM 13304]